MTVGELDQRMGSAEFAEWMALARVEPWGPYRSDLTSAIGAWASAAPWASDAKVGDFLPAFDSGEQTEAERVEKIRAMMLALGGKHGQPKPG